MSFHPHKSEIVARGCLAAACLASLVHVASADAPTKLRLYVGTYTRDGSQGIYTLDFDAATGSLGQPKLAAAADNPSFVAIHPNGQYLYACNELAEYQGAASGAVTAYAIDSASGELRQLNQKPSYGTQPCHINIDRAGRHVLFANYGSGSAAAYAIAADGSLGERTAFVQHTGSSVNPARQQGPHAHSINLDAAGDIAVVADLGLDKIMIYRYDADTGALVPNDPPSAWVTPGGGPRHFAFHPDGKHAYANNEITSTVTAFTYDAATGTLTPIDTDPTLPAGFSGQTSTAETVVHPSGKFAYVSNRGHNSIAVFHVDAATGHLTPAGHQGEGVNVPRNFFVEPSGRWMLVANQAGNSLTVFEIDQASGALKPTDHTVEIGSPVCVRAMPAG